MMRIVTSAVTELMYKQRLSNQQEARPMSQLRLAYVNCRIASQRIGPSSERRTDSRNKSDAPPLFLQKANQLLALAPGAAAVVEELMDELLAELAR